MLSIMIFLIILKYQFQFIKSSYITYLYPSQQFNKFKNLGFTIVFVVSDVRDNKL